MEFYFIVPLLLGDLWHLLDSTVEHGRRSSAEVDRYLSEVNVTRSEDPLVYWAQHKHQYPHLYQLALTFILFSM